jgi:hypothetical protein
VGKVEERLKAPGSPFVILEVGLEYLFSVLIAAEYKDPHE